MEEYLKELCAPHFWPIVITIAVMMLIFGSGVGLKPLINAVIKWFGKADTEVNVNIGGEVEHPSALKGELMAGQKTQCGDCQFWKMCQKHGEEALKSEINKEAIDKVDKRVDTLWEHHEKFQDEVRASFAKVQDTMAASERTILANQQLILAAVKDGGK